MGRPRIGPRIYWRARGGDVPRAYGNFETYKDVGGRKEALVPEGQAQATTDAEVAQVLFARRLQELQGLRRGRDLHGLNPDAQLEPYAAYHLEARRREYERRRRERARTRGGAPPPRKSDWNNQIEIMLAAAADFFTPGRNLAAISTEDVRRYVEHLRQIPSGRRGPDGEPGMLTEGSVRAYLNALSGLYRRAASEGKVPLNYNPVSALLDKPSAEPSRTAWLEPHEAALLLESARTYPRAGIGFSFGDRLARRVAAVFGGGPEGLEAFQAALRRAYLRPQRNALEIEQLRAYMAGETNPSANFLRAAAEVLDVSRTWLSRGGTDTRGGFQTFPKIPAYVYPLLATFLLTGAREDEVLGLRIGDVRFNLGVITFWEHRRRGVKTFKSERWVPLWPQLEAILREYLSPFGDYAPRSEEDLLFRSARTGEMITDWRKALDAVAERAGWEPGAFRTRTFRHTYISMRLQTLDHGHPVSEETVAREVGHTTGVLIRERYGHLLHRRQRREVVEYRVEEYRGELADRLVALEAAGYVGSGG